jgi:C-terminal processing protease CtpA/Prc
MARFCAAGIWENRGITPDIEVEMDPALVRPEYPNYRQALPK